MKNYKQRIWPFLCITIMRIEEKISLTDIENYAAKQKLLMSLKKTKKKTAWWGKNSHWHQHKTYMKMKRKNLPPEEHSAIPWGKTGGGICVQAGNTLLVRGGKAMSQWRRRKLLSQWKLSFPCAVAMTTADVITRQQWCYVCEPVCCWCTIV